MSAPAPVVNLETGSQPGANEGVDLAAAEQAFQSMRKAEAAEERAENGTVAKTATTERDNIAEPEAPEDGEHTEDEATEEKPPLAKKDAASEVEVSEQDARKIRLRGSIAARQRAVEEKEARLKQTDAEHARREEQFQAREKALAERAANWERLEQLRLTNPTEWAKETKAPIDQIVASTLSKNDPKARQREMELTIQRLPELIEQRAKQLVEATLNEREQKQREQMTAEQGRARALRSEMEFVEHVKGSKDMPTAQRFLERHGPQAVVHQAYYIQSVFQNEHGRRPSPAEIAHNLERFLGDDDDKPTTSSGTRRATSPRTAAREVATKHVSQMTEEERIEAAKRVFEREKKRDEENDRT